jgi:probable F420-dependent oxidoreductase
VALDRVGPVKVRIGFGLGTRTLTNHEAAFGPFVADVERLGFDSLWLSERVGGEAPDPVVGLAYAAGRTERLKLGTSVLVLPGRNPVLVAKELASLDRLSGGRLLPAFGLGVADPHEQQAFGVERKQRGRRFDEALPLLRALWAGGPVSHDGEFFRFEDVQVLPAPVQQPLEIWLGGVAPSELERTARLGDGWLPSFCTPGDVADGRRTIERIAGGHGRTIDPEHFGALIAYRDGPLPDLVAAVVAKRRPGIDPAEVIPSRAGLPAAIDRMIDAGASKFVVVPVDEPQDWSAELEQLAAEVLPLQTTRS